MAGWFAKLMQKGHARSRPEGSAAGGARQGDARREPDARATRDARHDDVVRALREREAEDRLAREKRLRGYRQSLESDPAFGDGAPGPSSPARLGRVRTKVPCRTTPEARALLVELRRRFPGGTVTLPQVANGRQAVMLATGGGAEPKQVGWVEHCVETDPARCNVRHQGLSVETDGGRMLVLRFRYPATAVRMARARDAEERASAEDAPAVGRIAPSRGVDGAELPGTATGEVARVEFAELRLALEPRPADRSASPRHVWFTRPEVETSSAVRSRDYEAFYVRFKLEVLAGLWSALSGALAGAPGSLWHRGSHYTVVRKPDAAAGRIHQTTIDDGGRAVDVGADRVYDAAPATDILLLHLEGDILADIADVYFTLQGLGSSDAWLLKEELFTVIRRFWAGAQSLASRHGGDLPTVVRMALRAIPNPAQAPLLKQDWTHLRQSLVDRYGEGGRKAADLAAQDVHRPTLGLAAWPFATVPAGEIDVGLRVIHRQEWRHLGAQRGEVLRTLPPTRETPGTTADEDASALRRVGTTVARGEGTRTLGEIVDAAVGATTRAMKWPLDPDGRIATGARALAARTGMGPEAEYRESDRERCARLGDVVRRMASAVREGTTPAAGTEREPSAEGGDDGRPDGATYVHSRLQQRYEELTRPVEIQNVVLVAEKLPAPAEIDLSWVRRHDWILAQVLLDESYRGTLESIGQEAWTRDSRLHARRERLYEHVRANILHYQRAIWRQEDPQQRSMRYRKSGRKVPLEWRFELESGPALTIDELADRLASHDVDGQFAAYAAGREAELDEVIDPAGPIGYHGNCAVYLMRPELGSAELFSMLHFFKSPYLRANPVTGEPEVEDPVQIRIADDAAVTAASDEAIEAHREEMLRQVPELRLELARARRTARDGAEPGAAEPGAAALRRHYATLLFRRERAHRIALDTDGTVIDVLRAADAAPMPMAPDDDAIVADDAPEAWALTLDGAPGLALLSPGGVHGADAGWSLARDDGARGPALVAGAGAARERERDADATPVIRAGGDDARAAGLRTGRAADPAVAQPIHAGTGGARLVVAAASAPARDASLPAAVAIVPRGGGLMAGPGVPPAVERAIRTEGGAMRMLGIRVDVTPRADETSPIDADEALRFRAAAGAGAPPTPERLVLSSGGGERAPDLHAGRPHDPEPGRTIRARGAAERIANLQAGAGVPHPQDRVIIAHDERWLRPILVAS